MIKYFAWNQTTYVSWRQKVLLLILQTWWCANFRLIIALDKSCLWFAIKCMIVHRRLNDTQLFQNVYLLSAKLKTVCVPLSRFTIYVSLDGENTWECHWTAKRNLETLKKVVGASTCLDSLSIEPWFSREWTSLTSFWMLHSERVSLTLTLEQVEFATFFQRIHSRMSAKSETLAHEHSMCIRISIPNRYNCGIASLASCLWLFENFNEIRPPLSRLLLPCLGERPTGKLKF